MSEYQDLNEEQEEELTEEQAVDEAQKADETDISEDSEDDLEPRYRGKSAKEIAKMHQEAEKLIARQAQEVGEVRRLADELIKSQLKPKTEEEPAKVDFFENPEEAIRRAVESHPKLKKIEEDTLVAKRLQATQDLLKKHPDALDLAHNDEFRNWVGASKVRQQLAVYADTNYDVDAADELYSTFKALKGLNKPKVDATEKANRETTLKKAAVDMGGSGESSKKVYRRSDIIQLKLMKPQEFEARREEIERAYSEGRVR